MFGEPEPNICLILDDCSDFLKKSKDILKTYFFKGRHLKITLLITT